MGLSIYLHRARQGRRRRWQTGRPERRWPRAAPGATPVESQSRGFTDVKIGKAVTPPAEDAQPAAVDQEPPVSRASAPRVDRAVTWRAWRQASPAWRSMGTTTARSPACSIAWRRVGHPGSLDVPVLSFLRGPVAMHYLILAGSRRWPPRRSGDRERAPRSGARRAARLPRCRRSALMRCCPLPPGIDRPPLSSAASAATRNPPRHGLPA